MTVHLLTLLLSALFLLHFTSAILITNNSNIQLQQEENGLFVYRLNACVSHFRPILVIVLSTFACLCQNYWQLCEANTKYSWTYLTLSHIYEPLNNNILLKLSCHIPFQRVTFISVAEWMDRVMWIAPSNDYFLLQERAEGREKKKTRTRNFNQCLIPENYDTVKLLSLKLTNHIKRILKYRFLCIT